MSAHSPTPWMASPGIDGTWWVRPTDESFVPSIVLQTVGGLDEANAKFIVRAVNAHDALVAALKAIDASPAHDNGLHDGTGRTVRDIIRSALVKAGQP